MNRVYVAITLMGAGWMPRLAEAQCQKWDSDIDVCDMYPTSAPCVDGGPQLSFAQERAYWNKVYRDDPVDACKLSWSYHPTAKNFPKKALPIDAVSYGCYVNWFNMGYSSTPDNIITLEDVTREPCCELTPNGPYKSMGMTGTDGGDFNGKRDNIRMSNLRYNRGVLRSDVGPARPPVVVLTEYDNLYLNDTIFAWEDDMAIPYISGPQLANVDHIIPRKDIYGCDCGNNSYANALVISWDLNNEMSNQCDHPDRQAILNKYALP